ncbi:MULTISPECIES: RebB family R body protein [unclassified Mameliella]|uniref:RebB family R body protein n=1 Tax=unclassified Mameliella TaxID=2630630 RepID=UPI00273E3355|nr:MULTISPECIES: RebB family R body protein [unclassified Mameliella]
MVETVNPQVTDAVTQSNVKVVSEAPAMALGSLYQAMSHSTGILFENAVNAQQQAQILAQAATNQGVMQIYSLKDNTNSLRNSVETAEPPSATPATGGA